MLFVTTLFTRRTCTTSCQPKNGRLVTVEYDTLSDFGRVHGNNLHSVDGMILANGYHVLREDFAASPGVARSGTGSGRRE